MAVALILYKMSSNLSYFPSAFSQSDHFEIDATLDASSLLVEEELELEQSVEYTEVFVAENSMSKVTLLQSATLNAFLGDTAVLGDSAQQFGVHFTIDADGKMWGAIDKDSIVYDDVEGTVSFGVMNWYKVIIDLIGRQYVSGCEGTTFNNPLVVFTDYLETLFVDSVTVDSISFNVVTTTIKMYGYYIKSVGSVYGLSIANFMKEVAKHFGCYFYIDGNKVLQITNRGKAIGTAVTLDDLIEEADYEKRIESSKYNGAVANGEYSTWLSWQGGTVLSEDDWILFYGNRNAQALGGDMANIGSTISYIDLRQKFTYDQPSGQFVYDTDFNFWYDANGNLGDLDADTIWSLYENLFSLGEVAKVTALGTNYSLFQEAILGGQSYRIFRANTNFVTEKTQLELKRTL